MPREEKPNPDDQTTNTASTRPGRAIANWLTAARNRIYARDYL